MTTKEILKENYQQFYCELGSEHIDTRVAKKLYDNYCIAEQETIDKACEWLKEYIGHGHLVRMHHPEGLPFERICTELSVFIPTFTKAMKG